MCIDVFVRAMASSTDRNAASRYKWYVARNFYERYPNEAEYGGSTDTCRFGFTLVKPGKILKMLTNNDSARTVPSNRIRVFNILDHVWVVRDSTNDEQALRN